MTLPNVDGGFNLTVNAVNTTFNGNLGASVPLYNLVTDAAGTTQFASSLESLSVTNILTLNDNVTVANNFTFAASNVTLGKINPVVSGLDVHFQAGNNLTLASVGNLTSFGNVTMDSTGLIRLSGQYSAIDSITFNDDILFSGSPSVNASLATFAQKVDGSVTLRVNADTTIFSGNIGTSTQLLNLFTDAKGSTTINGMVRTSCITFLDNVTLGSDTVVWVNNNATFNQLVDGGYDLTVNAIAASLFLQRFHRFADPAQ